MLFDCIRAMILNGLLWRSKDCEVEYMSEKIEEWINADQAAEFFGVKPATIREWIRKGKGIPATKIGKQWKFKYSELDAWAKSGAAADDSSDNE